MPKKKTGPAEPDSASPSARKNARGQRQSHAARLPEPPRVPRAPGGSPPGQARGVEVQQRIEQAALECFGAFGFAGTSTRAVAERAGVSHPLLIYHFGNKENLWRRTMEAVIGRYQGELYRRLEAVDAQDARAGLIAFIDHFVAFSAQTPELHRIMTQQSTQGSDRIGWLLDNYLRDSFRRVCALIESGQAQGWVRRGDPARLYYAVIGLGGTLFCVSTEYRDLTGRDVFDATEWTSVAALIHQFLFI